MSFNFREKINGWFEDWKELALGDDEKLAFFTQLKQSIEKQQAPQFEHVKALSLRYFKFNLLG